MQTPTEKNIIPIFSKRKRPRQALYAYPSQGTGNAGGTTNPAPYPQQTFSNPSLYTGHGEMSNWQGSNNSTSHPPIGEGHSGGWQGTNKPPNQKPIPTSNKKRASPAPYKSSIQHHPSMPHPGPQQNAGNMKRPLRPWQPKYDEPSVKTYRPSASPAPHSSNYQYAPRCHPVESQGPRFPAACSPSMPQQNMYTPKMQPSTMNLPSTHQPTMYRATASSLRQPPDIPHTSTSPHVGGLMRNAAPSTFRMPSTPQIPLRHPQPGNATWEMRSSENAVCPVDKSMKMLTVSIEELRYWTVSRDIKGLLFFELFGTLNSAVCSNETGLAKKFTLKDGNHTLQCIFYETDRPLGPLMRGQHLRCVGNILAREGVFRCVSVRPATISEQKVMRSMVAACDKGVRERLSATGIEP